MHGFYAEEAGGRETRDLLQLLHTAQRAAGGRRLWGTDVDARLRNMQKEITRLTGVNLQSHRKESPSGGPEGSAPQNSLAGTPEASHTGLGSSGTSRHLRDHDWSNQDQQAEPLGEGTQSPGMAASTSSCPSAGEHPAGYKEEGQRVGAALRSSWLQSASLLKAMLAGGDSKVS